MANSRICSIPNCGKPVFGRGWCASHYKRWRAHGNPLAGGTPKNTAPNFIRDEALPFKGDDCLIWPFAKNAAGYAVCASNDGSNLVHRRVCEAVNGPAPSPKYEAAHNCGNGNLGCINPRHLRWDTTTGNQADRLKHGTHNRGSRHAKSKLFDSDIVLIRKMARSVTHAYIAKVFGVSRQTVDEIINKKIWGWLE